MIAPIVCLPPFIVVSFAVIVTSLALVVFFLLFVMIDVFAVCVISSGLCFMTVSFVVVEVIVLASSTICVSSPLLPVVLNLTVVPVPSSSLPWFFSCEDCAMMVLGP